MFDASTLAAIDRIAAAQNYEPAALQAVAEVESNGQSFAMVNGKPEPLIRWEGHYFDARLTDGERAEARKQGLSSPTPGAVKNPQSQAARWAIVTRAAKINKQAALESFSIGLGQVMTAQWKKLGFGSVQELIQMARSSVGGQIELMARFIDKFGLADELQRHDFTGFARGYNGPGYKKNAYNVKMANAYQRLSGKKPVSAASGMLRMGSTGARVRDLQMLLVRAGYAVTVDGDYGPATRDAVKDFQKGQGVTVDGVTGPETMRQLEMWKQTPKEQPGAQRALDVPEVKDATKGGMVIGLFTALQGKIADVASQLTGIDADAAHTVANWLLAGSGVIGVGLAAYALVGWVQSRHTDEGDIHPATAAAASGAPEEALA